jgi:hypothetical protein
MHKKSALILALAIAGLTAGKTNVYSQPQAPDGAWQQIVERPEGNITRILLFSGAYFSWTEHGTGTGAFIATRGGSWRQEGDRLLVEYEFDTEDKAQVGREESWKQALHNGALQLEVPVKGSGTWEAVDPEISGPLYGPWLFSGRESNGTVSRRDTDQPRKTMKLLTGSRFQWIAYNTETKEFFGTGGGSYTAENGVYTERIEFFSRDNARVGAELRFEFEVGGDDWHHRGKSSAGEPMYEIWSRRK